MKLLGLTGLAGSGKDTAADYLVQQHAWRKVSFAQPLKDGLCAMFGWSPEQLLDREWKETPLHSIGKSPRQLMQTIGTEWGRDLVHPELWLILAAEAISAKLEYHDVVVSDVRFENEAALVRRLGGRIVHINRAGIAGVSAHPSEGGISLHSSDIHISNNGDIAQLHKIMECLI